MKKQLLFFCLVLFHSNTLLALKQAVDSVYPLVSYIHYGEKEGLTSKTIYSVMQDKDGFIWMGTDAGVFRYDGKNFKQFTTTDGISDNEVFHVYQDHLGRIWFMTFNGRLSFWKDGKIYNPGNTAFLKEAYMGSTIRNCFEDKEGRLWFGTENGGFICISNNNFKKIIINVRERDAILFHVLEDKHGNIWTLNENKMFQFLNEDFKDTVFITSPKTFTCYYGRTYNEIYLLSANGVYKLSDDSTSLIIDSISMPVRKKINNTIDDGENLWLCVSGEGCYKYKNGIFEGSYLNNILVTSIIKDREGNLWFGTIDHGVYMLPAINKLVTNINQSTGLSGEKVISIALEKNGTIWLGYENGIVDKISKNYKKSYVLITPAQQHYMRITALLIDSGNTWCGTDLGIYCIRNSKVSHDPYNTYQGNPILLAIKRIFKDRKSNIYATSNLNLMQLLKDKNNFYPTLDIIPIKRTFAGVEYEEGRFLISGMRGLMEYIPGKETIDYKTDVDFSSIRILDMKPDEDHLLVLGTGGKGIYIMRDDKEVQHISKETGLSDNNCSRIYISGNRMYVSTINGLNILEKHNNRWSISEIKTTENGILSDFVNDIAVDDKNIYIATDEGLSILKREDPVANTYIGKVMLTEVLADTIHYLFGDNFTFNGNTQRLLIRFAYPVFNPVNAKRIKYRLLDNLNNNSPWNYSRNNEVEFSSLNPGNYIFQLKPDLKTTSNANITSIYLNIKPLWWQTKTAKTGFGLFCIGFIAFIISLRTKRKYEIRVETLKQQNVLETERNRIASDMHDDIGADLTQINMLSNIVKVSHTEPGEILNKISFKSNEVLQKMDHIIWTLDSVHDHLPDLIYFINQQTARFLEDTNIELSFEVKAEIPDYKIDSIKRRNISLVLRELVHNSVKHSDASKAGIQVYFNEAKLHVIYNDNGKGYIMQEVEHGLGHTTMKKRMQEINSTFDIRSNLGEGVYAHLIIPLN